MKTEGLVCRNWDLAAPNKHIVWKDKKEMELGWADKEDLWDLGVEVGVRLDPLDLISFFLGGQWHFPASLVVRCGDHSSGQWMWAEVLHDPSRLASERPLAGSPKLSLFPYWWDRCKDPEGNHRDLGDGKDTRWKESEFLNECMEQKVLFQPHLPAMDRSINNKINLYHVNTLRFWHC